MLKDLCVSVTLLFLVSLSVSCLFTLSDCGMWYAPLFERMQGTELAVPHSSCIWSGLCLEGQRFGRRNLLSNFRIQPQQFNALFYLHRHVRLFGMVSKARIVHSGLKSNFCLEVCKSPGVVIYSYVPTVVFLFVCFGFKCLSPYPISLFPNFRNQKSSDSPPSLSLRSPSLSIFTENFTTLEAGIP